MRSDCGAASGFERQRLLIAFGLSLFAFVLLRTATVYYNKAVYLWDRLPYLSHVSDPCSGRPTLSDLLTKEGETALRSILYIFDECAARY